MNIYEHFMNINRKLAIGMFGWCFGAGVFTGGLMAWHSLVIVTGVALMTTAGSIILWLFMTQKEP
jgi:hypothetical protein